MGPEELRVGREAIYTIGQRIYVGIKSLGHENSVVSGHTMSLQNVYLSCFGNEIRWPVSYLYFTTAAWVTTSRNCTPDQAHCKSSVHASPSCLPDSSTASLSSSSMPTLACAAMLTVIAAMEHTHVRIPDPGVASPERKKKRLFESVQL